MSAEKHTTRIEYQTLSEADGYRFGSDGSILSTWQQGRRKPDWFERRLKPNVGKRGYYRVNLRIDGRQKHVYVHTMIATAFLGPCPVGMECRHLDGDRLNNRADNLAWGTPKENVADQFRHGTYCIGERRNSAKFTEDQVREIRRRHESGEGVVSLAREYGVNHNAIGCIVRRKTWKHVV